MLYPVAWLLLLAPLIITLSAIVAATALVAFLFGWKLTVAAVMFILVALYTFRSHP